MVAAKQRVAPEILGAAGLILGLWLAFPSHAQEIGPSVGSESLQPSSGVAPSDPKSAQPSSTQSSSSGLGLDTSEFPSFSEMLPNEQPSGLSELNELQFSESDGMSRGLNFNEFPRDYLNGLTLKKGSWGVKLGGYVKADLNHDFRAIDSTDTFDPSTIPVNSVQRTNTRFHTRQTRLNIDARWITPGGDPLRLLVEGDFFGAGDSLRLRHAYGEFNGFIIGQTWSTLTHRAALPNTLDLVGDVASVGRRQSQIRWTKSWSEKRWAFSVAVEDSKTLVEDDVLQIGVPRSVAPDAIARLRFSTDEMQFQLAAVGRQLAFQPNQQELQKFSGGGLNATGFVDLTQRNRIYGGLLWGKGIGNYRELPDLALIAANEGVALESLSWYSGLTHEWSKKWTSNLTFSQGELNNTLQQSNASVHRLQYLAANLIWQPTPHTFAGTEYLWGLRENRNGENSDASRLMVSFGFLLP